MRVALMGCVRNWVGYFSQVISQTAVVFVWKSSVVGDWSFITVPDEHCKLLLLCS